MKPSIKTKNTNYSDRNNGGWINKKYNYMSWALSCLQFKKYYDEVELITDSLGYDLLINKLKLPYTTTQVCLDSLNNYNSDLWALGKIYAYRLQEKPFIHADGDVFIYKKFEDEFLKSPLIAQNFEVGFPFYNESFKTIQNSFNYIPEMLMESRNKNNQIIAVNAGLLGGTNIDFIKEYTDIALKFVNLNLDKLDRVNIGIFNTVYEQFLFYALSEEKDIKINCLLKDINHRYDGIADIVSLPHKTAYVHTVGGYKIRKHVEDILSFRLQTDYPEYFYRILNLLRTNQI